MIDLKRTHVAARRLEILMTLGIVVLLGFAGMFMVESAVSPMELAGTIAQWGDYEAALLSLAQSWALIGVVAAHLLLWFALLVVARRLFR